MASKERVQLRGKTGLTPIQRFVRFMEISPNGCWLWTGGTRGIGYGSFYDGERNVNAHRWLFQRFHPVDLRSDQLVCHTCNNPPCVNPGHMYVGDCSTNELDCVADGGHSWASRTHCLNGHKYNESNTRVSKKGHRECRACQRNKDLRRRRARGIKPRYPEAAQSASGGDAMTDRIEKALREYLELRDLGIGHCDDCPDTDEVAGYLAAHLKAAGLVSVEDVMEITKGLTLTVQDDGYDQGFNDALDAVDKTLKRALTTPSDGGGE